MSDSRFSSSFIPKSPVIGAALKKESMGLFQAVAGLIFLLSILSIGGIFAYKKVVQNQINGLRSELATLESQINKADIDKLVSFDRKLMAAKELLTSHVAVSNIFKMLETNTVTPVHYTSFKYNAPAKQDLTVELEGKAGSYRVVSEQEKVFLNNPNTLSVEFKDLNYDETKRESSFVVSGVFSREVVQFAVPEADLVSASTTPAATSSEVKKR